MKHLRLFENFEKSMTPYKDKIESVVKLYRYYLEDEGFAYKVTGPLGGISSFMMDIYPPDYRVEDKELEDRKTEIENFIKSNEFLEFIDRIQEDLSGFNISYKSLHRSTQFIRTFPFIESSFIRIEFVITKIIKK